MMRYLIVVAGGKGLRMGGDIPKQFLAIGGKPILMHTLEAFHHYDNALSIVLVLPADQQSYWQTCCQKHHFHLPYTLADGGETRFHSVQNGLAAIATTAQDALVAIHDGVRPFVKAEVMEACYHAAALYGAAVPVVDMVDSVRRVTENGSIAVNRSHYKLVQTPQAFQLPLLRRAYQQPFSAHFTDDASVVEALGAEVTLVAGNRENIKITTPYDIKIATALLAND